MKMLLVVASSWPTIHSYRYINHMSRHIHDINCIHVDAVELIFPVFVAFYYIPEDGRFDSHWSWRGAAAHGKAAEGAVKLRTFRRFVWVYLKIRTK